MNNPTMPVSQDFPYDVFLSHSAKDKVVVRPLAERLRADRLKVWFDEWALKPGDNIPAKIEEGLEHSRVLVLCMSAQAFGSDWAQLEAGTLRFRDPLNRERRFIPLRLDDAPIKGSLAQFLYINWHPAGREQEYEKLLEACRAKKAEPLKATKSEAANQTTQTRVLVEARSKSPVRFLVVGAGDLVKRLKPTWQQCKAKGVELVAVDIQDRPVGLESLGDVPFYSLNDIANLDKPQRLNRLMRGRPFDVCLVATYPWNHLLAASQFNFLVKQFVLEKPVDSSLKAFQNAANEREGGYQFCLAGKLHVHAHYRNKPVVARVKRRIKEYYSHGNKLEEVIVFVTEERATPDARQHTLEDGLILDLASQAFSVVVELFPKSLEWDLPRGGRAYRNGIKFIVTDCFRAHENYCNLPSDCETFSAISVEVAENVVWPGKSSHDPDKPIRCLVVVGMGVKPHNVVRPSRANDRWGLKGIHMKFEQGDVLNADFSSNRIIPEVASEDPELVSSTHGGINLPFFNLINADFSFERLEQQGGEVRDFQSLEDALTVVRLVEDSLRLGVALGPRDGKLTKYTWGTETDSIEYLLREMMRSRQRPFVELPRMPLRELLLPDIRKGPRIE